jgi:SET domain
MLFRCMWLSLWFLWVHVALQRHSKTTMTTTTTTTSIVSAASASASAALECHLYMGQSTIPHAGLGIFTGKAYHVRHHRHLSTSQQGRGEEDEEEDDEQYIGLGDICIPVIDMQTHINVFGTVPVVPNQSTDDTDTSIDSTTRNTSSTLSSLSSSSSTNTNTTATAATATTISARTTPYTYHRHDYAFNPLRDYFWNGYSSMGMIHGESTTQDIEAYCPGLDCAINCHLGLINIDSSVPQYNDYHCMIDIDQDPQQQQHHRHHLRRQIHPGTGAYSPYHIQPPSKNNDDTNKKKPKKRNLLRDIPVGGELFKHYGDAWFTSRESSFGNIPLTDDYYYGEQLLQKFLHLTYVKQASSHYYNNRKGNKSNSDSSSSSSNFQIVVVEDLYNTIIIQTMQRLFDTRTLNALPSNYTEILHVLSMKRNKVEEKDNNNDRNREDDNEIIASVLQSRHQRSITELEVSGTCLDHIHPNVSTLPYAGDGAFATRFLPKNTVITISPLHHIPNYHNFMNMYHIQRIQKHNDESLFGQHMLNKDNNGSDSDTDDDMTYYRVMDEIQNHQLLMNYCYGHVNSTLLLCPYGSGINYLNHHSTLHNVRMQWIPSTSSELLSTFQHNVTAVESGTVEDLLQSEKAQLAIQYVTTRDIQKGEEVFLHYGVEWEHAWNKHMTQFLESQNRDTDTSYISAAYWNSMMGHVPLPTAEEVVTQQQQHPLNTAATTGTTNVPNNLYTRCHLTLLLESIGRIHDHYVWSDENHGVPCTIMNRYSYDYYMALEQQLLSNVLNMSTVVDHNEDEVTINLLYTVQLEWNEKDDYEDDENDTTKSSSITWIQRTDVPRSAIKLFDVPFTSDIHQRRTFRHPIYLPDDVFPQQWRNL